MQVCFDVADVDAAGINGKLIHAINRIRKEWGLAGVT